MYQRLTEIIDGCKGEPGLAITTGQAWLVAISSLAISVLALAMPYL